MTLIKLFIQESAAPSSLEPGELVISAIELISGSRSRTRQSGAACPLTIEEVAALQEDWDSDSDASTVLLEEFSPRLPDGPPPVPEWSPAPIPTEDPLFGHAEPIRLSEVDP